MKKLILQSINNEKESEWIFLTISVLRQKYFFVTFIMAIMAVDELLFIHDVDATVVVALAGRILKRHLLDLAIGAAHGILSQWRRFRGRRWRK